MEAEVPGYTVKQGECLTSIAEQVGFHWKTIWDHKDNATLKELRRDPSVLQAGDVLIIPEKREKIESANTEKTHKFRRRGIPARLRLRFQKDGKPMSGQPYFLSVVGSTMKGQTDDKGIVEVAIPARATEGTLVLGVGSDSRTYRLNLGNLDPIESVSGVQGRLRNLGHYKGRIDGKFGQDTRLALKRFQRKRELKITGEIDEDTRMKLQEVHGS